jgi:hypothetical protein
MVRPLDRRPGCLMRWGIKRSLSRSLLGKVSFLFFSLDVRRENIYLMSIDVSITNAYDHPGQAKNSGRYRSRHSHADLHRRCRVLKRPFRVHSRLRCVRARDFPQ